MRPGDVYMINDPYVASTHCNDIHFVKPVFWKGQLVAFTSSTAHWSDVGGVVAGSLNCNARSQFEEGMRIPAIAICKEGEVDRELVSLLVTNMRQSWERMGDLNAQLAAVRAGDTRVQALLARHGVETFLAAMAEVQDHAERLSRAAFAALPDGVYTGEDRIDQDVATGEPVTVRLRLTIEGDQAVFDLEESDGAAQSGINCTIAATTSAVFIGMASILPPMPMNAGVMRAITIRARPGSIVWAQPPAAISGLAITSMDCVIGAVLIALGKAQPDRAVGLPSACVNSTFAGYDARPEFETSFINYVWAFGGTGAHRSGMEETTWRRRIRRVRRISPARCKSAAIRCCIGGTCCCQILAGREGRGAGVHWSSLSSLRRRDRCRTSRTGRDSGRPGCSKEKWGAHRGWSGTQGQRMSGTSGRSS